MSELAGIRARLRMGRHAALMYSVSEETKAHYMQFEQNYSDVEYLLSKLEIAEKALEKVNAMGYNELVCADHNTLINKALQQIRE